MLASNDGNAQSEPPVGKDSRRCVVLMRWRFTSETPTRTRWWENANFYAVSDMCKDPPPDWERI